MKIKFKRSRETDELLFKMASGDDDSYTILEESLTKCCEEIITGTNKTINNNNLIITISKNE